MLVTLESGPLTARIVSLGGILTELWAPDRDGRAANVVLGLPAPADYAAGNPAYFGAICGRYANRIAGGRFTLDGVEHELPRNDGENTLHGGPDGFDRREWEAERDGPSLLLRLTSPDGDMGFPGELRAEVRYTLSDDALRLDFQAETDRPTLVNLTSHVYWNLAGEGSGPIDGHVLELAASRWLPTREDGIPTGEIAPVEGTPLDYREPRPIAGRAHDHCVVLDGRAPAARLRDPASGRLLELTTTQPGLQVYTGTHLDGTRYRPGDGLALEAQHFPDSPNRPAFPSTVLRPGERFAETTLVRLTVG